MRIRLVSYKGKLQLGDGIKVANKLTLRWEDILDCPGGPRVVEGPCKWKRKAGEGREGSLGNTQPSLLAVKMEERAMGQGMKARKQSLWKGTKPCPYSDSSPGRPCLDF